MDGKDRRIVRATQEGLPLVPLPYHAVAEATAHTDIGGLVPVIDRCFTLSETPDAIRHLETGHARGKVVITVAPAGQT